jgi:hypothetical protein
MPGFIKSHSNYRLQTRHQTVDGGVILERDISTVGGVNTFATGQATVYQSGNFVITVTNGSPVAHHVRKGSWLSAYDGSDTWDAQAIEEHKSDVRGSVEESIELKNDFMDLRSFAYYGSLSDLVENTVCSILKDFPYEIYLGDSVSGMSATTMVCYNPGSIDIVNTESKVSGNKGELGHFSNGGYLNYEVYEDGFQNNPCRLTSWNVTKGYTYCDAYSPEGNPDFPLAAKIDIEYAKESDGNTETTETRTIYALYVKDGSIIYNWKKEENESPVHIRPKESLGFYGKFADGLDLFGKCLIGEFSGTRNVSRFEVLDTENESNRKTVKSFTFPVGEGGYNVATEGIALEKYLSDLGQIAMSYDEYYTDNMYRMMTHESLKNLDWTRGFNGNDDDSDSPYLKTGEKFASMIRVMGYVFDNEKAYIDSIGNVNRITYSDRSNLSDYFLSDSLESDGWVINTIYPYKMTLLAGNLDDVTDTADYSMSGQTSGIYERRFSEITKTGPLKPYGKLDKPYYVACDPLTSKMTEFSVDNYSGQTYEVANGNVYNVITGYHSEEDTNIPDINNEFEKRLKINSKNILRKKGTVEGIESMLAMFGMRSKRWVESHSLSSSGVSGPDFDIEEYSTLSPYIYDYSDGVHEHRIDWYNKCKTIPYYIGGRPVNEYISYQGLPVAYRDAKDNERRLYPYFDSQDVYDGGMYYQMNGGWLKYTPYMFGTGEKMILKGNSVETKRDVMLVSNITELVSQSRSNLYKGVVYYVNDLSGEFAVIDGYIYPISSDAANGKYFTINVYGGSVSVGGELYENTIEVSTQGGGTTTYNLSLYSDGYPIRIFYTGNRQEAFIIRELLTDDTDFPYESPDSCLIFMDGNYDGDSGNTHYFVITDIDWCDRIGDYYWRQVKDNEELFIKIDSVTDNYNGNNPHFGGLRYDNGLEYVERYIQLFKYPIEKDLFNTSCFPDIAETMEDISEVGFDVYNGFIRDSKVHSFADVYYSNGTLDEYDMDDVGSLYNRAEEYIDPISSYGQEASFDGVTSQVINLKNMRITFYIDSTLSNDDVNSYYTKEAQEQMKYIQCKVMPYVEQVLPSTSIVEIRYAVRNQ